MIRDVILSPLTNRFDELVQNEAISLAYQLDRTVGKVTDEPSHFELMARFQNGIPKADALNIAVK